MQSELLHGQASASQDLVMLVRIELVCGCGVPSVRRCLVIGSLQCSVVSGNVFKAFAVASGSCCVMCSTGGRLGTTVPPSRVEARSAMWLGELKSMSAVVILFVYG